MFNLASIGFVKVAFVADYGNFHAVPRTVTVTRKNDRPFRKPCPMLMQAAKVHRVSSGAMLS